MIALRRLTKAYPGRRGISGLLKVLGYSLGVTHLSGFLAGEFYSLVYLVILAIYAVFTGTKLMAHLVDNGFMGCLLATPVSRRRVACTQALVLLSGVCLIAAATTAGGLLGAHRFAPRARIAAGPFVEMNLVGMLVFTVVAAYSYPPHCLILGCAAAVLASLTSVHRSKPPLAVVLASCSQSFPSPVAYSAEHSITRSCFPPWRPTSGRRSACQRC